MAVQIEDDQGLAEVMPFEGRAGVDHGQGRVGCQQVVVVCSWNYNVDEQALQRFLGLWFPYYQLWYLETQWNVREILTCQGINSRLECASKYQLV